MGLQVNLKIYYNKLNLFNRKIKYYKKVKKIKTQIKIYFLRILSKKEN